MNERIRQLTKQCYETGPIGKDGWPEYSRLNEEKFAELIVQECIDTLYKNGCSCIPADRLKEHFGVEE